MAEPLFTHFWLLCGAWVGGGGALFFRHRLRAAVAAGELESTSTAGFAKVWLAAIMIPCVILWLIQLSAGSASPHYLAWPVPQKWLALGVNIVCWLLLLWWVWFAGGAQRLSKIFTVTWPRRPTFLNSAIGIKVVTLLVVLSGVFAVSGVGK